MSTSTREPAPQGMTYAEAGVDIEAGDEVVRMIKPALRRTYSPRVMGLHGAFAGMFRLDFNESLFKRNYRDPVLVACTDGVGTKVMLAIEMDRLDTIGIDCVAMNVNDLIVQGAEPLFFLDYLGLSSMDTHRTVEIIKSIAKGCEIAGCSLIGGECAEMPDIYREGDFDVAGFAVGVVELKRATDPTRMAKGDVILGLASSGVHSNGYTLVRKIIESRKLDLNGVYTELDDERTLGEALLEPTRIYARSITQLLSGYTVKKVVTGMAHITGGGLPGNLNRALPEDLDAKIDLGAWEVPPIFRFLQSRGGVDEEEMYRVFNMGIGYCLVVRPTFAKAVERKLTRLGETVYRLGTIVKGKGRVRMTGTPR